MNDGRDKPSRIGRLFPVFWFPAIHRPPQGLSGIKREPKVPGKKPPPNPVKHRTRKIQHSATLSLEPQCVVPNGSNARNASRMPAGGATTGLGGGVIQRERQPCTSGRQGGGQTDGQRDGEGTAWSWLLPAWAGNHRCEKQTQRNPGGWETPAQTTSPPVRWPATRERPFLWNPKSGVLPELPGSWNFI